MEYEKKIDPDVYYDFRIESPSIDQEKNESEKKIDLLEYPIGILGID